jgi:hypothetical protein
MNEGNQAIRELNADEVTAVAGGNTAAGGGTGGSVSGDDGGCIPDPSKWLKKWLVSQQAN